MGSEVVQLAVALAALVVVAVLWFLIVFLPKRTMERDWRRSRRDD